MTTTPTYTSTIHSSNPDINRLYDNVQAQVPGVVLTQVQMAAWNTIEDFFLNSTCRREKVYWQMPGGVDEVDFNPFDADWFVAWILDYTGLAYGKIEPPGLLKDVQFPAATSIRSGSALLALKPQTIDSDFGALIWQQWFETIFDGTLYRLYRQPAKPWSSPQLSDFHGKSYRAGVARARAIAQQQFTDGGGRWRYPYFAHGRRKN